jgi:3-deoxy-D-manno-octulosonic-acid transferase
LSVVLYNIFLFFFRIGIRLASLFNPKAKKWVDGRRNIFSRMREAIKPGQKIIWVHCASLGEFEQGRPVMEALKTTYPDHRILLTFFSPSGYEVQKNYTGADWVFYLPIDGPANARQFLEIVQPVLVVFVKYEFWYYYLKKIKYRQIPLLLISALFRRDMSFFKWYGGLQRKILSRFDHLFVQNQSSLELIREIGLGSICSISGDTRFDRVSAIAAGWEPIPQIGQFAGNSRLIVAGSSWPEDEALLKTVMTQLENTDIKLLIAPHEINEKHLAYLDSLFPGAIRFSTMNSSPNNSRFLIIDNVGMLSRLYRYAWICYIGGGLRKSGIHNVLEAAVYSRPVFFGPFYSKYSEAIGLVTEGGASSVTDGDQMTHQLQKLISQTTVYDTMAAAAGKFVESNTGAVNMIMQYIQEKRLLTS